MSSNEINIQYNLPESQDDFIKNLGFDFSTSLSAFFNYPGNEVVKHDYLLHHRRAVQKINGKTTRDLVHNCPFEVPKKLQRTDFAPPGKNTLHKFPAQKYPFLFDAFEKAYYTPNLLLTTYANRLKERPVCMTQDETGEAYIFRGMVKGCPDYNLRLQEKIKEKAGELQAQNSAFYFLTVTYAQNIHGKNIIEAWQIFNIQIKKLMQAIRRKYGGGYCCVLESTLKGYPHAHILIGLPQAPDIKHNRLAPGQPYKYGKFLAFLQQRMPSPRFKLQKAEPYALTNYLCKYVSKGMEKLAEAFEGGQKELGTDDIKALLSCLCPILASVRQFRSSIKTVKKPQSNSLFSSVEEAERLEACAQLGIFDSSAVASLISVLNNLTVACKGHVWAIFNSSAKAGCSSLLGYYPDSKSEIIQDFKRSSYPLGCPGCVITDWVEKMLNKKPDKVIPLKVPKARRTQKIKPYGRSIAEVYAFLGSQSDSALHNLSPDEKTELDNMGMVVENDYVAIKPDFIYSEVSK